ncbi:MAG: site-specific integrase, partial [Actinobacteria bacterium]|nr:site-specific integrase [Actinomycetota bacterium]
MRPDHGEAAQRVLQALLVEHNTTRGVRHAASVEIASVDQRSLPVPASTRRADRACCEKNHYHNNQARASPRLLPVAQTADRVNASLSHQSAEPGIRGLTDAYLAELEHAGRSAHTLRAYRSELARLAAFHDGPVRDLDVQMVRAFLATRARLSA